MAKVTVTLDLGDAMVLRSVVEESRDLCAQVFTDQGLRHEYLTDERRGQKALDALEARYAFLDRIHRALA